MGVGTASCAYAALHTRQNAFPFLIGMKYDHFTNFSLEEQEDITKQVRVAFCLAAAAGRHADVITSQRGGYWERCGFHCGQARKFAKAMKAPLIFTSASHSINVQKLFKVVLSKVFELKCTVPMIERVGDPILQY